MMFRLIQWLLAVSCCFKNWGPSPNIGSAALLLCLFTYDTLAKLVLNEANYHANGTQF